MEDAHGAEADKEEGASIADKGEGKTGDGGKADTHADIDIDVDEKEGAESDGDTSAEGVACDDGGADDGVEKEEVASHQGESAEESGFFCDHGEDKVVVGYRVGEEPEEVLGAFADSFAGHAAGSDGKARLIGVVPAVGKVAFRVEKGEEAFPLIGAEQGKDAVIDGFFLPGFRIDLGVGPEFIGNTQRDDEENRKQSPA